MPVYRKRRVYRKRPMRKRPLRKRYARKYKKSELMTAKAPINRIGMKMGFPNCLYTRLTYQDDINLGFTTGDFAIHQYRINSLYDPDITLTGHQPRFFDQYVSIYRGYQVYGCKVTLRGFTKDTSNEGFVLGMYPLASTSSLPVNYNDIVERGVYKRETTLDTSNPVSRKKLRAYFKPWVAQGVPHKQYLVDSTYYAAGIGANPLISPRFIVYGHTMDQSTATQGIDVLIEIVFYCKFFDRRLPSQS